MSMAATEQCFAFVLCLCLHTPAPSAPLCSPFPPLDFVSCLLFCVSVCTSTLQGLYKQMVDIMKGLGVDAVETVGSLFDPELHEAIMREPNDEVPDGTVIMEFRKGFRMGERLLRPAMVKVSFSEAPASVSSAETDSEPESIDASS